MTRDGEKGSESSRKAAREAAHACMQPFGGARWQGDWARLSRAPHPARCDGRDVAAVVGLQEHLPARTDPP